MKRTIGFFTALAIGAGAALAAPAKSAKPAPPAKPLAVNVNVAAARADLFGDEAARAIDAAGRLGTTRQPGALDALLDALAMGLPRQVALAAVDALGAQADAHAADVLLHYTRDRRPDVRAHAVTALGGIDDKRAAAAVTRAFHDFDKGVRAAACQIAAARRDQGAVETLLALMRKGDEASAPALAALANVEVARRVTELINEAPPALIAQSLGAMLLRPDLGPESAYVEVVHALGKVPGEDAVVALTNFIGSLPASSPRASRREAQAVYEQRLQGAN